MFPFLKKSSFFAHTFISRILSISNPQWGVAGGISHFPNKKTKFVCPIAFTNACHVAFATDTGAAVLVYGVTIDSLTTLTIYSKIEASDFGSAYVLAIGK